MKNKEQTSRRLLKAPLWGCR